MLFLDSSLPEDMREFFGWGVVHGVTTNPLILAKQGAENVYARIKAIAGLSEGPLSVQLTSPAADILAAMNEAGAYEEISKDRIVIKVPFSPKGLVVNARLKESGFRTNLTCIMSFAQAYLGVQAGADYVSIFAGRIRDMGYEPKHEVSHLRRLLDRDRLPTKIIVGSIRHPADVSEAANAGAHIVTVPPKVLREMTFNPRTESTIEEFNEAWRNRGQE